MKTILPRPSERDQQQNQHHFLHEINQFSVHLAAASLAAGMATFRYSSVMSTQPFLVALSLTVLSISASRPGQRLRSGSESRSSPPLYSAISLT